MNYLQYTLILATCFNTHLRQQPAALSCKGIDKSIRIEKEISSGRVKRSFYGFYHEVPVVLSYPADDGMKDDFKHGMEMLLGFQGSGLVTELLAFCKDFDDLKMVTKFYHHGSLDRLDEILERNRYTDEFEKRLQLSLDYVTIIDFLHDSPLGTRVMCDTNDLNKTLSQYLITDDFRLIVNDLDALPEVKRNTTGGKIKCGSREIFGDFVAPEQLWPHEEDYKFEDRKMPGYDEKTDIWKIPDVLLYILGRSSKASQIKFRIFQIISRCKNIDAELRPTAAEVKSEIERVFNLYKEKKKDEL